jgi:hypothetical protein
VLAWDRAVDPEDRIYAGKDQPVGVLALDGEGEALERGGDESLYVRDVSQGDDSGQAAG